MTKPFLDIKIRLTSKVEKRGDCWIWQGSKGKQGYGNVGIRVARGVSKTVLAHRCSYQAFVGEIADGMCVLHRCDNPSCINPDHLFLGTNKDNVDDKVGKGRTYEKLSDAQVLEIRTRYVRGNGRILAKEFNVCPMTISLVVRGRLHNHSSLEVQS